MLDIKMTNLVQVLLQLSSVGMIGSLGLLGFHYHSDSTSPATPLVALMVLLWRILLSFAPTVPRFTL